MIGSGAGRPGAKKGHLAMLIIGMKPKGSDADADNGGPPADHPEPDQDDAGAMFHDQTQTCSTCGHFDPNGNGGIGACGLGVPEADYRKADPDASGCNKWAGGQKEEGDETDEGVAPATPQTPATA